MSAVLEKNMGSAEYYFRGQYPCSSNQLNQLNQLNQQCKAGGGDGTASGRSKKEALKGTEASCQCQCQCQYSPEYRSTSIRLGRIDDGHVSTDREYGTIGTLSVSSESKDVEVLGTGYCT